MLQINFLAYNNSLYVESAALCPAFVPKLVSQSMLITKLAVVSGSLAIIPTAAIANGRLFSSISGVVVGWNIMFLNL